MTSLGAALREAASTAGLDGTAVDSAVAPYDDVDVPGALAFALGWDAPPATAEPAPTLPTGRVAVVAGPDVLRWRAIDALHAFADAAGLGVANTWGAKGVYPWDDPHHLGTIGLQARDFELVGLADADAILAVGVDALEAPVARLALAPVVAAHPTHLPALTAAATPAELAVEPPELFRRLAAVAQPGYVDDRFPRHPARAVMDLKRSLPADAIVSADAGPAGLWVARTFPTDRPGSVVVPAWRRPAAGAAVALLAALHGRPAVAVTTEPEAPAATAMLDLARAASLAVRLVVWGDDVDLTLTRELVDAAGPVVAWTA